MSDFGRFRARAAPVPAPDELLGAVAELSEKSGHRFLVSQRPVEGTRLDAAYALDHSLPSYYPVDKGTLGFRLPDNFPDAQPEDSFFIQPPDVKLKVADTVRNSMDINRAGIAPDWLKGLDVPTSSAL